MNKFRDSLIHQAGEQVFPGAKQQLQQALETGQPGDRTDVTREGVAANSEQPHPGLYGLLQMLIWEHGRLTELNETLECQLERQATQVQALVSALSQAELQERKRIAQLLHDDLQQLLYSQGVRLKTLRYQLPTQTTSGILEQIEQMLELVDQAIKITRTLVVELNPPGLEAEKLTDALQWLAAHMKELYDLDVQLTVQDSYRGANPEARPLLVQMLQELLFNIVKHAKTNRAAIDLWQEDGMIIISIADNGQGFIPEAVQARRAQRGGFGLFSIKERINLIGGRLEIESGPGQGALLTLATPVEQKKSPG